MNKAQIISHTKDYMDMLAKGADVIRKGKQFTLDEAVNYNLTRLSITNQ